MVGGVSDWVAIVAVALAAGYVGAWLRSAVFPDVRSKSVTCEVLRTRKVELIDDGPKPRAVLSTIGGEGRLEMIDREGKSVWRAP